MLLVTRTIGLSRYVVFRRGGQCRQREGSVHLRALTAGATCRPASDSKKAAWINQPCSKPPDIRRLTCGDPPPVDAADVHSRAEQSGLQRQRACCLDPIGTMNFMLLSSTVIGSIVAAMTNAGAQVRFTGPTAAVQLRVEIEDHREVLASAVLVHREEDVHGVVLYF